MFRTLFVQEARTQLRRNAAVLGLGTLLVAGFLVLSAVLFAVATRRLDRIER